jgi:predicted dehydrogenase
VGDNVEIALVGAGGYGTWYLNALLYNNPDTQHIRLVGVVDPYPERCVYRDELEANRIPFYTDLTDLFANHAPSLVCIASPIHLHLSQTLISLEHGANVLCEKPVCATVQDVARMAEAEAAAPGFVAVGYQWSFADAIQKLKQDVMSGILGKPLRLKSRIFWPRPQSYYERNRWAGRIALDDGTWVLDSPVNNATAHYLHNMFYVLGSTRETSAALAAVQAELYRANPIENYDTAALRCMTETGVEILFYTSHAVPQNIDPIFEFEFEDAVVCYDGNGDREIVAAFRDGHRKPYGNPTLNDMGKIWQCVDAIRTGRPAACGIAAATPLTRCVNGAQESPPAIGNFPPDRLRTIDQSGSPLTYVDQLDRILLDCYERNLLPSESGQADWAAAGRLIDLKDYHHFPRGAISR